MMPDTLLSRDAIRYGALSLAAVLLSGCASFSQDGGFGAVSMAARERLGKEVTWVRSEAERGAVAKRVAELLGKPLTVDDAVQVALFNNRKLQAAFAELAISEADLVQAGRLPNPGFSMLRASQPGPEGREYKIEQAITFNLFSLITLPQASAIEKRRFEQTQRSVSLEVLQLAAETRIAYYNAVAAAQRVQYARQVVQAAQASAELARRMARVGNFNKLQQAQEQEFYAEAALEQARAEQTLVSSREKLTRLLGVWGPQTQYILPDRLPALPLAPTELDNVEQMAMQQRLDVQAARLQSEALARHLGLTKVTRLINVLEFGPARVLEGTSDAGYKHGYEVSLELPLFDWGTARTAKAEALYMQSVHVAAQTAIDARSDVREAYQLYRSSYDIARHYRDEIVPLKKRISEENQLRYNGMFIGVFELLADARSQISSVNSYMEALRDFWIAQSNLEMSLAGKPLSTPSVSAD